MACTAVTDLLAGIGGRSGDGRRPCHAWRQRGLRHLSFTICIAQPSRLCSPRQHACIIPLAGIYPARGGANIKNTAVLRDYRAFAD